jgi:SAM-dependent methyltransferase
MGRPGPSTDDTACGGPFAPRSPARLDRPQLPGDEIERIRLERRRPRVTQWDYLHLNGLRRALLGAFRRMPSAKGPVLDLFCGTKPYLELIPWRPLWGSDLDRHFGRADVVAGIPLPFRDDAFGVVLCTQALHLVDDPSTTVAEMARVLVDDGRAIVTIPHLFLGEASLERHWSRRHLTALFDGWRDVHIAGIDGPGVALSFVVGRVVMLTARRSRVARALFTPTILGLNGVCALLDRLLRPMHGRWPHSLLLVARRPAPEAVSRAST